MARSIVFVNDSGSPWILHRFGGLIVPAGSTLNVTSLLSDNELVAEIQKGLGTEFDSQHYLQIGGVNKSAAESQGFLTPKQAGGSAILGAAGDIDDAQHGVRGGGTLHAVATQSVTGFMAAADKTKLDTVAAGAYSSIQMYLGDNNGPGAVSNSSSPTILRYGVYCGTSVWTPNKFAILADTSNAARPGVVDFYDVTNGNVLASITNITDIVPTIRSTTTFSNLPATEVIVAVRAYWTLQSATITCYSAQIFRTP